MKTMIQNPFQYGRPVTDPAYLAGRHQETRTIFSRLGNMESTSILGERRIGKTSFLKCMSHADTVRASGRDPEEYLFIFVDLEGYDRQRTPATFWCEILDKIDAQACSKRNKDFVAGIRAQSFFATRELGDLFDSIGREGSRVILCLDEFDSVTGNPNFDPDFFSNLRSLAIHHNLALVTASHKKLVELCHSKEVACSPLFNIFANVELGLLTPDEARELVDKALACTPVSFDRTEQEYVEQIAGRHPCFLQMAAYFLFESHIQQLNRGERFSFTRQQFEKQSDSHFFDYWHRSGEDERITLLAMALLSQAQSREEFKVEEVKSSASRSERVLRELARRGLLRETGGRYALFSPLFGEWIIGEVFDPLGRPDRAFEEWLSILKDQAEPAKVLEKANNQAIQALSKVKRGYRKEVMEWLTSEPVTNTARILVFLAEVVRLVGD